MDLAELSNDELVDQIKTWAARVARGEAELLDLIGELDAREAWGAHGVTSCAHWLSWKLGWSSTTSRERSRVARSLRQLPLIRAALGEGRVSYCQVRAITRVATVEDQTEWLELARHCTGEQLELAARGADRARAADRDPSERAPKPPVRIDWDDDGDLVLTMTIPLHQAVPLLSALEQLTSLEQSERDEKLAALVADFSGASAEALTGGLQLELPAPRDAGDDEAIKDDASPELALVPVPVAASAEAPKIDLTAVPAARFTDPLQPYPYVEPPYPLSFERTRWTLTPEQRAADDALIDEWERRRDAERAVRDAWNTRQEQLLMQASAQRVPTGKATLADALVRAVLRPTDCPPVTVQLLHDPLTGWARTPHDELLPPTTLAQMLQALPRKRTRRGPFALAAQEPGADLGADLGTEAMTRYDLGRTSRIAGPALRKLLGALDGEHCRFPGCTHTRYLHAHHVTFWSDGGPTDLANMVLLCTKHHRLLHKAGYVLALDDQRNLTVTTPDGLRLEHRPQLAAASAEALPPARPDTLDREHAGGHFDLGYVVSTMLSHAA